MDYRLVSFALNCHSGSIVTYASLRAHGKSKRMKRAVVCALCGERVVKH